MILNIITSLTVQVKLEELSEWTKKVCKNIRIVYNKIHKFNSQFGCIPYANECELKLKINKD